MTSATRLRTLPWHLLVLLAMGCAGPRTTPIAFQGTGVQRISGLGACTEQAPAQLPVDAAQPLVVLVHGCNSSEGRFRALAEVFALHGQQTVCFYYRDRERITASAARLRKALLALAAQRPDRELVLLGHSQGGLVARAAVASSSAGEALPGPIRLITVSSPFAGIEAARDCGLLGLHLGTLGTTVGICRVIAGAKWNQIHPAAKLVQAPRPLDPAVREHLLVVTDERDTCRRREGASCAEDDFVFSVAEQRSGALERDPRVQSRKVAAGHVEIVGEQGTAPDKLIGVLQQHGVLAATPADKRERLARLLRRLF
jgi:pimeloyl-ACP methyl ester carboxylesterase